MSMPAALSTVPATVHAHAAAARAAVTARPETVITVFMSMSYWLQFGASMEMPAMVMASAYVMEAIVKSRDERPSLHQLPRR